MRSPKFDMEITSPENLPEDIKVKVLRRAKRHFEGKNVVHRVISKNDSLISFKFNRQTHKYASLGFGTIVTVIKVVPEKKSPAAKKPATKKAVKAPKAPKSPAAKKPATKKAVKAPKAPKSPAAKKPVTKKAVKAPKAPKSPAAKKPTKAQNRAKIEGRKPFDWSPV